MIYQNSAPHRLLSKLAEAGGNEWPEDLRRGMTQAEYLHAMRSLKRRGLVEVWVVLTDAGKDALNNIKRPTVVDMPCDPLGDPVAAAADVAAIRARVAAESMWRVG